MKIDIENIEAILLEKKIDKIKVQEILKELEQVAEEEKEERQANKDPKGKWENIIILNDKEGYLKDKEIAGWVAQYKEGEDSGVLLSKLVDAAKNQNEAAKRKKSVISDFIGLFESLKPKWLKEKGVRIKTKELVRCIITDGKFTKSS